MTPTKAKISVEDLQSEVKRLSKALKERDAALAVINSVTEGLASGLEVDAIFELVGKRISKIFSGHAVALYTFDESTEMAEARFMLEKGVRHSPPPFAPGPIGRRTMASKKPLMISTRAEFEAMGAITIEGTEASQSGIYAPLFVHDKVVGAMNIENPDAEHAFSPADLRLVTTLANSVSVALESARLFGELQKSNLEISQALEHQTAMSEILHVLAAAPSDIQTVLAAVAEAAARLCEADDVQIYRVDGNRLPQVAHFGPLPALKDGESLPLVPGLITGRAVLEQRMIHIEDFAKIARDEYPESAKLQKRLKHRSVIVTPLLREGQAIGALVVRRNDVQPFSEKHITLLSTFADQAAIAIENVRLFHETQQRAQELAIINSVQAALAAKLDMQAIYEAVGDKIHEVFSEAQVVDILHYDVDTKLLHPRYVLEKGKRYSVEPWPLRGFRKHVIETGRPLVINQDMQEKMVEYDNDWVVLGEPSKSWIGVPMIVGAAVKGVISLQHLDKENAFSDSDVRLLQTLANSMSVALENARLFDESQRLLKETEERNAELAIINTVQRALSAQLDIRGIYEAVGEKLRQIFDSQTIAIYSADLKQRINTSEYAFEKGQKLDPVSQPFSTLHDHLVELSDTYVFNGDFPEFAAQFVDYRVRAGEMPKSIVGVPIISKQDPDNIVTLTLQDIDGGKIFTDSDVRLLETLANSMSVALENARLFDETQRLLKQTEQRAAELEIINSVQEGLAARSDLQAIYDLIGNTIRDLFSAESMYIAIVDQPENVAHYVYFLAMGERVFGEPPTAPKGFGGHVYTHRQPLRLSDITAETMREYGSNFMGPQNDENMAHSWMGAPISSGEDVLGMVSILNQRKDFFTESDLRLLSTLTNGMGVALENARLFDETQRLLDETKKRAAELQIINSVQEGLASKLNLQDIYDLVGEKIHEIFKADTTFIAFHDQEKAQVIAPYYVDRGEPGLQGSRPYGKGLVEVIIESGQPVLFNTAQESAEAGAFLIASPGSDKDLNEAFIGVPIFREGKAIGATSVQSYQQYAFNRNDLSLLQTLTNSMSVALERARLFDETQHLLQETEQHAAELSTINTVSQALIAKSDLDALINLIGEQMRQTFSADIVYVALLDRLTNVIQFPYTYGDRFDPLPLGEGLTSKILQSGEALLINREMEKRRTELGITQVGVGARSYLGVPIQRGGQTFGVISVQSTQEEGRFNESDLRLLSTIAANVSTVIRNAQLFDEIKHQKQYYETVIENSPAAIVLLDKEAAVTGWNPAAEKLFGYTEAEALGENIDNLVANADSLHAEAVRYSQKALADKQVHLLARRTRKDGSMVDVEVSGVPIQIEGQEGEFIAIYHDVSELQRAREEAEQANQAKSTFLANMSHELRTPLNAILGFTRIVKRKGAEILPEKQIENLDKVLVSADHLLGLINSVLDISKIEAGRMDVRAAAFELPSIINLVVETSQTLMREGVKLEADLPAEFPLVFTDQDKLKQILINLLSNAAKFTHQGKITIAAREASDMLYIDVSDTGIGISEEALERIFEEFQQADSSTTRVYGGTGLGLSISRRLARLLGGNLAACSIEGEGSTFTLTLPLRYKLAPTDEGSVSASAEALQAPTTDLPLILSIDDDPNVHELLKENLGERGYQVIGVCSGDEGIRLARELLPFAITLDIMMPGKDGWQVLHELKDDPATRAIPVILITIVDKQTLGYQLGAADYLVKPLEEGAVLSALQHILGHDRGDTHIHLLVVDDDPNISEMVGQLLEATPYQIEGAPDGRSALEAIRRHPPDVILLDLMMPNMDGFALIESLREEDLRIPIIVLTAKTLTAAELDILEGSVAQIIQKNGLEPEKLLTQLQTTVEQLRGRGTHA